MSTHTDSQQIAEELRQVQRLFAQGQFADAVPILEGLIPRMPTAVSLYVALAQAYEVAGSRKEALMTWRDVRHMRPDHPTAGKAVFRILMTFATERMNAEREKSHAAAMSSSTGGAEPISTAEGAPTAPREATHREATEAKLAEIYSETPSVFNRRRGDRRTGDRRRPGGSEDYEGPERRKGERRRGSRRASAEAFDLLQAAQRREHAPGRSQAVAMRAVHLTKRYKRREVVSNVNLTVRQGEIVGLLGPNGAGKTTTFYMIVGLVRPNEGKIFLGEDELTDLPMYKRSRKGVGYLAQESSIFVHLTVEANLHAVLEYQGMPRVDRQERVDALIEEFRLETVRRSKGYTLSGGERRRTEIARALATKPRFFLLDEPFAGVDPIAVEDIQQIVASLKEKGIGVLITDHNVHETLAITDRAYLLYEGKILMQGSAEALASDPEVRKRYLGENFKLERYA